MITEGNWEVNTLKGKLPIVRELKRPHQEASHYTSTIMAGRKTVCRLDFGYGSKNDEDNARLIAASKDLLEACLLALKPLSEGEDCGLTTDTYNVMCKAIAKAKN